jgi:hypothetical protein
MVNAMYFIVGDYVNPFPEGVHCYAFHRTRRCFTPRSNQSANCERAHFSHSIVDRVCHEKNCCAQVGADFKTIIMTRFGCVNLKGFSHCERSY